MATENTHFGARGIGELLRTCKSLFFIGIGGINMSSLAHLSLERGYRVGGSDRTKTALTERLREAGAEIFYGHSRDHVADYDAVVYTVAIAPDNPEYRYALEQGLPCISRADYLGYLMTGYKRRVGVAGTHGKSSCTSMCAQTLMEAGADPTVLSGAALSVMEGAYRVGGREDFLFEACEYMDSFLDFNPTVAVILNIEMDHVDYFKSMEQIRASYARYAALTGREGYAVYNADDGEVLRALASYEGHRLTFGIEAETADYRAVNLVQTGGRYTFEVWRRGSFFCRIALSVTGRHHVYNALAAAAVCDLCGLSPEAIGEGLGRFLGAARRMEWKGRLNGACVYDDYGHHPTEIRATLTGARGLVPEGGRLFCVYQPHTYSRTAALFSDFVRALSLADRVLLTDIYAARETDTLGVSSALLAETIGRRATFCGDTEETAHRLAQEVTERDAVVVMGAGDIDRIFAYLKEKLKKDDERM